jgi:hypothetical protein
MPTALLVKYLSATQQTTPHKSDEETTTVLPANQRDAAEQFMQKYTRLDQTKLLKLRLERATIKLEPNTLLIVELYTKQQTDTLHTKLGT